MAVREETIASVYANALLDLAFEKGVHREVLAELTEFDRILEGEAQFALFLGAPQIRPDTKKEVLDKVFGSGVSEITLNFLKIVIDKRRQHALTAMIDAFKSGYHERMGELVVDVESAVPLQSSSRERLLKTLRAKYNKEIILQEHVRDSLLGGIVIRVGDSRIDGSLRSRLQTIGSRLDAIRLQSEDYYED
ncbi:MAG: ATP synthase F1 subunit delta [Planctomycetota bacterium]